LKRIQDYHITMRQLIPLDELTEEKFVNCINDLNDAGNAVFQTSDDFFSKFPDYP